ncbi:molybdopterin biosynthesis enzyme [Pseudomonas sp. SORGH_AS199]|nr:molybdopterin biosynthesis enzyme [Pseudomonas sp. SORGH_AS_0199]
MSLLALEEALARLLALAAEDGPLPHEQVALENADGRILAAPLVADLDLPPWDNSAMDGYALRLDDWQGEPLRVSQRIFAGQAPAPLEPGTCARIFTGAPVPAGADCVEMQENTEVLDDRRVRFVEQLRPGRNIRRRGNEVRGG